MPPIAAPPPNFGLSDAQLTIIGVAAALILGIIAFWMVSLARRNAFSGYRVGAHVIVRCREGHLFTTTWIPMVSVKAIRLGPIRFQYCPTGNHMSFVTPVNENDLTDAERRMAHLHDDGGVP
jgi:hypothetical protein